MLRLREDAENEKAREFQRAPTLGGECYSVGGLVFGSNQSVNWFQRAPTLGGECYTKS